MPKVHALVHVPLWTEILLSENKGDNTAQLCSELHAKEVTTQCGDSVFKVAYSVLRSSSSFAFTVERIPCQPAHMARPRSCIVLLAHARLPGSNPSQLTASKAKCL